ncbi:MAG: AhpC/TSA family protein [Flavobacteriaceae bacterium]
MKKIVFKSALFLLLVSVVISCKQEEKVPKDSFTVSGTIEGLDIDFMSSGYRNEEGKRVYDSIFVKDNHFSYTRKISKPEFVVIWPRVEGTVKRTKGGGYYPVKSSQFAFIAEPGAHIKFEGDVSDFINAYPTGTPTNIDLAKINRSVFPLMNKSVNILLRQEGMEKGSSLYKAMTDSIKVLDEEVIALKKKFVTANTSSKAAVWYLSDMMLRSQVSDEEAIKSFKAIDVSLNEYSFYKEVAARVKGIESTLIGKTIPNFTTNRTLDGKEFTFNSLIGKYVLIDFWGTWCGPCVAEMPTVKEYQDKYKDKLVVLGINSGESKDKIEKFITPKEYDWQQLISGDDSENFVLNFNVQGFPTKFIIDPEGKILHRFVGNGEESFKVLDELLK